MKLSGHLSAFKKFSLWNECLFVLRKWLGVILLYRIAIGSHSFMTVFFFPQDANHIKNSLVCALSLLSHMSVSWYVPADILNCNIIRTLCRTDALNWMFYIESFCRCISRCWTGTQFIITPVAIPVSAAHVNLFPFPSVCKLAPASSPHMRE